MSEKLLKQKPVSRDSVDKWALELSEMNYWDSEDMEELIIRMLTELGHEVEKT